MTTLTTNRLVLRELNTASNKLLQKIGFVHEGTLRQSVKCLSTGTIHDQHLYGILKNDWMKIKK